MKMKKIFLLALVVLTGIASSCKYDDEEIWDSVENLTDRVVALEQLTQQLNGDITAMQAIVTAVQNKVSVSELEEVADGYIIHFTDGSKAVIKHGKDGENGKDGADGKDGENGKDGADGKDGENGKDGADGKDGVDGKDGKDGANAPIIGIKKDGEVYYWTITADGVTDWLTDDEGNKMPVTSLGGADGNDGEDGKNGKDGVSPKIRIQNGKWEVSYDGGKNWETWSSVAEGPKGDKGDPGKDATDYSYFADTNPVVEQGDNIVIKLKDGQTYVIPVAAEVVYNGGNFDANGSHSLSLSQTINLTYEVTKMSDASVEILKTERVNAEINNGQIVITATEKGKGKVVILYYNDNQTITSVLNFDIAE